MSGWQRFLARGLNKIENGVDAVKYPLRERIGRRPPVTIMPYRGYGTPQKLFIKGRVLEDKGIRPASETDTVWDNLVNMFKRFGSAEIPFAQVKLGYQNMQVVATADEEGFFEAWLEPPAPASDACHWQAVDLELVRPVRKNTPPAKAQGSVFVLPPTARFGVISDLDDTVIQTDAGHMLHMARTVFLSNARTRLPFKGVAAFYKALYEGYPAGIHNPLFYVSSGPWNLYDLLSDFIQLQGIPMEPILFLRDWGITQYEVLPIENRDFKINSCRQILDLFTTLPFILIGDSGQEDPEIYSELVAEYPRRIQAVYIRNVSHGLKRPAAIRELAQKVVAAGSTLILADDTLPLAQHAIEQGWIDPASFPEIHAQKNADEAPANPVEKLAATLLEDVGGKKQPGPTVIIEGQTRAETHAAVNNGAIETALKESKQENKKPSSVVVKGEPD